VPSTAVAARTYPPHPGFDAFPTCPHAAHVHSFRWSAGGFHSAGDEGVPSPFATFVHFVTAISVNDRELAMHDVADPLLVEGAIGAEWGKSKGRWRVSPGTEATAHEMVFFRGATEAYRVRFESRGTQWLITDFQPTSRSIE
jgi:hypothetical protein